ncbi:MAG TPA: DUF547 domain-containing protein [Pelobium sp.]|nr:DUF547 domain-containing protein [Pelobium sp.]
MRKLQIITTALIFMLVTASCANGASENNAKQQEAVEIKKAENNIVSVDHSVFDKLLKANVSDKGIVDYKAFVKDKVALQNYIKSLTQVNTAKLNKNERTAFWINAYNALTIDQIVKHYPVTSITKIAGGKVWDQALPYKFDGKSLTLNDIEKKILLGTELFDARIHFAVNCAAVSCPTLINKAYTGSNVQEMLTKNTKSALSNPAFNKISSKSASISKLFDWYKADFVKAEGSVVNFINKYSAIKINNQTKIDYLAYNWSLNGIRN